MKGFERRLFVSKANGLGMWGPVQESERKRDPFSFPTEWRGSHAGSGLLIPICMECGSHCWGWKWTWKLEPTVLHFPSLGSWVPLGMCSPTWGMGSSGPGFTLVGVLSGSVQSALGYGPN
ncbi:hypothetical protein AAC387_Pa02g4313 [Persea americana]